jgi:hypothetical protein
VTVAFVQPFGVGGPGGGPRILRAMLEGAPRPAVSLCVSPAPPPATTHVAEMHVPSRPTFGRLEASRYYHHVAPAELAFERLTRRRLRAVLRAQGVACVHLTAHDMTLWPAFRAARSLGLPVAISVHDDMAYNLRERPDVALALRRLGRAWREADHRFVISGAMGREYDRRFGARPAEVITDGLTTVRPPAPAVEGRFTAYFMGAFHVAYRPNLEALLRGLEAFARARPDLRVTLRMRSGEVPGGMPPTDVAVESEGFADEAAVERDMREADLLWLPLPFGDEHAPFVRSSLSTKLVTYVGSGLPILYHGPPESAAGELLRAWGAAAEAGSLEPAAVHAALEQAAADRHGLSRRAGELAASEFMLDELRERFWSALAAISPAEQPQPPLQPSRP